MRAILIDPERRAFTEIQVPAEDTRAIQRVLGCRRFTQGALPLSGSIATGFDALYISDDVLQDDPRFWFQVDAERNPPSSYPIAGRGLVRWVDADGYEGAARISVAELQSRVTFTQRNPSGRARAVDCGANVVAPTIDEMLRKH